MTDMTNKIERFTLPNTPADGAEIDLGVVQYGVHRKGDFCLSLVGSGFDASRYMTRDEAIDLRDWLIRELGAR